MGDAHNGQQALNFLRTQAPLNHYLYQRASCDREAGKVIKQWQRRSRLCPQLRLLSDFPELPFRMRWDARRL